MDATKILLMTVTKMETQAAFDVFEYGLRNKRVPQRIRDKTYYSLGTIGNSEIFLVQSEMGSSAISGSARTVSRAIDDISPSAIILVGIAFGTRQGMQELGDVLVSNEIVSYEFGKNENSFIPHAGSRASLSLLDSARSVDLAWNISKVHFGVLLSGEKLTNNLNFKDQLTKQVPEAIGGEMEATGLYMAVGNTQAEWIVVKAISDWADRSKHDDVRSRAAANSASFVLAMIQHMNNLPIDVPPFAKPSRKTSSGGSRNPPPNKPPDTVVPEFTPSDQPSELKEIISQYTIQDNVLEKHAATDKPIQKIEQDKLGFDVYVTALHDFIVSQYTTTPLTISVDGPWGSGKSSLMYMLKNSLDPQDNIWRRFISGLITAFRWWSWFLLWFISLPVQTLGRALVWIALKFDKDTGEFDFRIGQNSTAFRSLITDIAQGLSTNPEVLQQRDTNLSSRAHWWARVHARCQAMDPTSHPTIWLNAWKFDNEEQVWASLALATLEQIKQKHNIFWMAWFRIRLTFRRLSPVPAFGVVLLQFVFPILLGLIAFYYTTIVESFDTPLSAFDAITDGYAIYLLWIGGILSGILTVSSLFKDPFQIPVDKVFNRPNYKDKIGFLTQFEKDFANIVDLVIDSGFGWKKSKLVIFVDDLDRCEPPKAADIVEAVNLFLDAAGCIFIIGMDSESVSKSIEVKYKDLFARMKAENAGVVSLGRAFLEKIVQVPFTVPRATFPQIMSMVESTFGRNISTKIVIAKLELASSESKETKDHRQEEKNLPESQKQSAENLVSGQEQDAQREEIDPASFAREEVRKAILLGTEMLGENPRQAKTFVNLFRLSIYIANAKGFFEERRKGDEWRLIGLERLAIWVACSVRWQNLVRHLYTEAQVNSLCAFLNDISNDITSVYKWKTGRNNIPTELKKRIENLRKSEKGSEAHWCHLPWEWWLLEPDFLQVLKQMEDLWISPAEGEVNQLQVLLNMSRPLSSTSAVEAK